MPAKRVGDSPHLAGCHQNALPEEQTGIVGYLREAGNINPGQESRCSARTIMSSRSNFQQFTRATIP